MIARAWPFTLLLCQATPAALAQANAPQQQVEIKADRADDTELRRREPVAKTIYGRDEIDKYGDTNLSDVLKRLPGVNVSGGNPRLRGLGAGYTLILINGEAAPPGFSLDNLSPSQVERIEVSKGPTAEHSAQAVAGTINIILREAPRQRQRELRLGVGYSQQRPTGSFNGTYGDRLGDVSLALPLSVYQWRNGSSNDVDKLTRDLSDQPQHLQSHGADLGWGGGFNFSPRLTWKLSDTDSLNWQSFAQSHSFHYAGNTATEVLLGLPPISVNDLYANAGRWQMLRSNLQLVRRWADGARVDLKAGVQASRSWFTSDLEGADGQGQHSLTRLTSSNNRERGITSAGKYSRPLFEQHSLALGWDVEQRQRTERRSVIENGEPQLRGYDGEPFEARILRAALYVQDEWEIAPQWSTYLGLRAERIGTRSQGSDGLLSNQSTVVTPLWHLNYKLDPKGRDLVRASLTRSYKAPELNALMARPSLNANYPVDKPNPQIGPDRIGNPLLRPELATGLDVSFEKYFSNGGLMSLGLFQRRIEGLIRNVVTLESVPWASVPRWVSRPVNLTLARSTGLEFEIKGRAGELLPSLVAPAVALNVRASLSVYRSSVDGLPAPDNRLEGQQPWSLTLGFDHVLKGLPFTYGASLACTPGYAIQQTLAQRSDQARARSLDAYALWAFSKEAGKEASLRVAAGNLWPLDSLTHTMLLSTFGDVQSTTTRRTGVGYFSAGLTIKF